MTRADDGDPTLLKPPPVAHDKGDGVIHRLVDQFLTSTAEVLAAESQ